MKVQAARKRLNLNAGSWFLVLFFYIIRNYIAIYLCTDCGKRYLF